MLNQTLHRQHVNTLLLKLFGHAFLGSMLGFKGGTAAYLFYNLPRFSVDLDFDMLPSIIGQTEVYPKIIQAVTDLVSKDYELLDHSQKYNTLFWLLSYGKASTHIKIEISTRHFSSHYDPKAFYGVTIPLMRLGDMMAHKLVAIQDRKTPANRDLFDAHFFLSSPHSTLINHALLTERASLEPVVFFESLLNHLETRLPRQNKYILDGLGELLTQSQKDWVRAKLLTELIELVRMQKDLLLQKTTE